MAHIIAVSALNKYVKSLLEEDDNLADIVIQGEISNFNKHYKTGHCYFSLKDESSSVKAVMFNGNAKNLPFTPQNGMKVLARGRVSLYERDGAFQVYVQVLFPDGVGAAQLAFEQLKERLREEGLFLEEHKKPLPAYPQAVGLVTSKTGAALQDILNVAARRCPHVRLVLAPVTVQGAAAAPEIAKSILSLADSGRVDAIIVARGGGSAEDLWVFNDEHIARAAFASNVPLVSAIGHETDYTILDFVADLRAPTPSAAAELVLPDMAAAWHTMENLFINIANSMQHRLDSWYNRLNICSSHPALANAQALPLHNAQQLRLLEGQLTQAHAAIIKNCDARLKASVRLAAGLNPYVVLGKGVGMLQINGAPVTSVRQAAPGEQLQVTLRDGKILSTVDEVLAHSMGEQPQ